MLGETVFELLHSELVAYTTENKENDLSTLEYLGFSTGNRLIERLTREYPRFKDELDTMKFICTDFWTSIYKKQIDNLRTNHQGIYVLQDNSFRFLNNLSNGSQYLEHAPKKNTMLGETGFELLHSDIVAYLTENEENDLPALEHLGYSTGKRLIERLTGEYPRFKDELDTMKFICTDFWTSIYKKQIDNLRTNHQGIYELQDNSFAYLENAPKFVAFTCGFVRGSLAKLGINSRVSADVHSMPTSPSVVIWLPDFADSNLWDETTKK
ncbi:Trafficking protein particle complex subunit 6b, partial [Pseudolycoriella hygida]